MGAVPRGWCALACPKVSLVAVACTLPQAPVLVYCGWYGARGVRERTPHSNMSVCISCTCFHKNCALRGLPKNTRERKVRLSKSADAGRLSTSLSTPEETLLQSFAGRSRAVVLRERPGTTDSQVRQHRSAPTPSTAVLGSARPMIIPPARTLTPCFSTLLHDQAALVHPQLGRRSSQIEQWRLAFCGC